MHGPNPQQGEHSSSRYMLQDVEKETPFLKLYRSAKAARMSEEDL